jgi:hypothetical protein
MAETSLKQDVFGTNTHSQYKLNLKQDVFGMNTFIVVIGVEYF